MGLSRLSYLFVGEQARRLCGIALLVMRFFAVHDFRIRPVLCASTNLGPLEGPEQLALARVVQVDCSLGDSGTTGDALHRHRIEAPSRKLDQRRVANLNRPLTLSSPPCSASRCHK
jgi:hypothetical protein